MNKLRIAQAGCGGRGKTHIKGIMENSDRFEMVGLCDIDEVKMKEAALKFGVIAPLYTDAEKMLSETKPDIFSFILHPQIRQDYVELGVKYGVKGLSFEKPMATSMQEAAAITRICRENGIKAVVSHQQKYLPSMQKLKSIVDAGEIGHVEKIHVGTQAWLSQLGTHFMDYALWVNGGKRALCVTGHVHGKEKLSDSHPSIDFANGTILLEGGVRVYFECGYLSEQNLPDEQFWTDNRLTVYGSLGYAWAETNGAWSALTKSSGGQLVTGQTGTWDEEEPNIQTPYYKDFADWMENDTKIHTCNVDISYHGFEVLDAICLSALHHTRIDLPLQNIEYGDINQPLLAALPDIQTYSRKTIR